MRVKTFRTERGAKAFEKKVNALWANLESQVCCSVGLDFRDQWYVEVKHPSRYGKWTPVGPFSKRAMHVEESGHVAESWPHGKQPNA